MRDSPEGRGAHLFDAIFQIMPLELVETIQQIYGTKTDCYEYSLPVLNYSY